MLNASRASSREHFPPLGDVVSRPCFGAVFVPHSRRRGRRVAFFECESVEATTTLSPCRKYGRGPLALIEVTPPPDGWRGIYRRRRGHEVTKREDKARRITARDNFRVRTESVARVPASRRAAIANANDFSHKPRADPAARLPARIPTCPRQARVVLQLAKRFPRHRIRTAILGRGQEGERYRLSLSLRTRGDTP